MNKILDPSVVIRTHQKETVDANLEERTSNKIKKLFKKLSEYCGCTAKTYVMEPDAIDDQLRAFDRQQKAKIVIGEWNARNSN